MENFEDSKSENPWQVDSVQAFLYLHCPECVFVTPLKEQGNFHDHAIENHPLSLLGVFGKSNIKEEKLDSILISNNYGNQGSVSIKQERSEINSSTTNDFEPIERDGRKVYNCSLCEYSCNKPSKLKVHISAKHENNRPFDCTECEKSFKAKHHLQRHFSTAHPEKEWLIKEEFYKSNSGDPTYDPKEEYEDQEDFTEFCEPYLEEIEDDFIDYSATNEYTQNAKPPRPKFQKVK